MYKAFLKQAGVEILVDIVVDHPIRQLDKLSVQQLWMMLLPHVLEYAVGRDIVVSQAV